jgi:Transposase DDE domain
MATRAFQDSTTRGFGSRLASFQRVSLLHDSRAALVLDKIRNRFPWLELVWADNGYNAWQVEAAVAKVPLLRLEIVKRSDDLKGFVVLPRRWVVERTFSWFGRNRRLAKDWENLAETLSSFVTLACIQIAIRRLVR